MQFKRHTYGSISINSTDIVSGDMHHCQNERLLKGKNGLLWYTEGHKRTGTTKFPPQIQIVSIKVWNDPYQQSKGTRLNQWKKEVKYNRTECQTEITLKAVHYSEFQKKKKEDEDTKNYAILKQ